MTEVVGVWRGPEGSWRWAYLSGDTFLEGNERHASREEAAAAASIAYPGVEIRDVRPHGAEEPSAGDWPGLLIAVLAGTAAAAALSRFLTRLGRAR